MSKTQDLKNALIERALAQASSSRFIADATEAVSAVEVLTRVEVMELESAWRNISSVDVVADALETDVVRKKLVEIIVREIKNQKIPY